MKFKNIKSKAKNTESPSNSRTIPASVKTSAGKTGPFKFSFPKINPAKLLKLYGKVLGVFVVFSFIAAVIAVGLDFKNNLQVKQKIDSQRKALVNDLNFWENFIFTHQNYPDAYFQASILEYKLGDISKAKKNVERGLSLNPNSENGKKLEKFFVNR